MSETGRDAGFLRPGRRIVAIANQKGGVGKTTTAVNLAAALAAAGQEVLIVDLDPQGNASTALGLPAQSREVNVAALLLGEATVAQVRVASGVAGLSLCPANMDLLAAELALAGRPDRAGVLRAVLRGGGGGPGEGFVLIDCPPAMGLLTLNALVAADAVLVPLQAEFLALEGLSQLLLAVREVRQAHNPGLRIDGVVLTMVDQRNRLAQEVERDVRATLGPIVFDTVVPRNIRIPEAQSHGRSVLDHDPIARGSVAYRALAAEYLDRLSITLKGGEG
jgi:chromosome partitioning protein